MQMINAVIKVADPHNPKGVDGKGHNRMAILPLTPVDRCFYQPKTYSAAWESHHRPHHVELNWASFEPCTNSGDCTSCPVAATHNAPKRTLFQATVVRIDSEGRLWLMNRQAKGWNSVGFCYRSWSYLLADWDVVLGKRGMDEHGPYIEVAPTKGER